LVAKRNPLPHHIPLESAITSTIQDPGADVGALVQFLFADMSIPLSLE
jgi:hypothetical protein